MITIDIQNIIKQTLDNYINQLSFENLPIESLVPISLLLSILEDETQYDNRIHILKKIINQKSLLFRGISLYYGISLFGTIIECNKKLIEEDYYNYLIGNVDRIILKHLEILDKKTKIRMNDIELINGLIGSGLYIINREQNNLIIIEKIISFLYNNIDSHLIFITPTYALSDQDKKKYPFGLVNMGLSHGLAGILVFLSKCVKLNILIEKSKVLINNILNHYRNSLIKINNMYFWSPKQMIYNNEIIQKTNINLYSYSWCHGISGILNTLFTVSISIEDKHLTEVIHTQILYHIENIKNNIDTIFISPSVCHGYCGLILFLVNINTFFDDNNITLLIEELLLKVFSFKINSHFLDYNLRKGEVNSTYLPWNILTGEISILLTLATIMSPQNYSYYYFLGLK